MQVEEPLKSDSPAPKAVKQEEASQASPAKSGGGDPPDAVTQACTHWHTADTDHVPPERVERFRKDNGCQSARSSRTSGVPFRSKVEEARRAKAVIL